MIPFALPGGRFHALTFGDPASPPVLWLHGFPDHPPTAVPFLESLARSRRVVAPWLRGYAPSPLAGPYDLETLAHDVIALIDQVGGPVDLVGHDWGAAITYAVCALAPERVRRAVTLAVPHPETFVRSLARPAQLRRSGYMGLFQLPGAERIVRAHDLAFIDRLWRTWSPGFALDAARREALHGCLAASLPGPLGYYRAAARPWTARALLSRLRRPLRPPFLQLHGAADGCVLPPRIDDGHHFVERTLEIIPNGGHFLHLEQPAAIASRVTAWLA